MVKEMGKDALTEELVSSSNLFGGRIFNLRRDVVKLPNGRLIDREVVEHPGAVAIVPIIGDRIILVRQFRHAVGKVLCEIPAGTLKRGESPDVCAARELEEETGYVAGSLRKLFHCCLAPGYSSEVIHVYLATGLKPTKPNTDSDEFIEVLMATREEALRMVMSNEIEDAKTISGILMLKQIEGNAP
jgi:ADP-ribose pyrophosphatase